MYLSSDALIGIPGWSWSWMLCDHKEQLTHFNAAPLLNLHTVRNHTPVEESQEYKSLNWHSFKMATH